MSPTTAETITPATPTSGSVTAALPDLPPKTVRLGTQVALQVVRRTVR